MKTFNQFIAEEYHSLFKGFPIFKNPSKSEIIEIGKTAKHDEVRFLSVSKTKQLFVWDADRFLHLDAFNFLKTKGAIPPDTQYNDYSSIFTGVATIEGGNLVYQGSDEMWDYIEQYRKPVNQWNASAKNQADLFYSLKLKQAHSFVERYIKGSDKHFVYIHSLLVSNEFKSTKNEDYT